MSARAAVTYVDIEAEDGILLARALKARHFGLELVLRLGLLLAGSVIALGLGLPWLALRRSLVLLLGCLAVVPGGLRLGPRGVAILRRRVRSVVRALVAHVAIVLRVLAVGRRLRGQRRRGDVAGGRLAEARPVVLRGRCPRVAASWVVGIVRGVVHDGGDSNWERARNVGGLTSCLTWVVVCCSDEHLGSLVHDGQSARHSPQSRVPPPPFPSLPHHL
jgi:hypothetical protein